MKDCCCAPPPLNLGGNNQQDAAYRRALWAVLAINGAMFAVEVTAGLAAGSTSLQADALDFLGDTLTYGLSLAVIGRSVQARSSAAMLKAARKRTSDLPNIDLRRGELEALPIDNASCDAALLLLVLTYANDPPRVIAEMSRILKPGGRAVVMDLLPHDRDDFRRQLGQLAMGFAPEQVSELLSGGGFVDPTVRPLPPQPQAKGPALFVATATRR